MSMQTSSTVAKTLRLIVMTLGQLTVACRIETVYKVVKHSQVHGSGLGFVGLAHIDDHEITVLDLNYRLFNVSTTDNHAYFVIVNANDSDLIAIPVITSPNLIDVPREQVRVLPETYRRTDTLDIASHVAVIHSGETTQTIFILDENALVRLLPPKDPVLVANLKSAH